jgi:hypothetical protein
MRRRYDHIDLRGRNLAEARPFYEVFLPVQDGVWLADPSSAGT